MDHPKAYRIADLVAAGPFGRSFLFDRIRDGSLIARKAEGATIILADDWNDFLTNLPVIDRRQPASAISRRAA